MAVGMDAALPKMRQRSAPAVSAPQPSRAPAVSDSAVQAATNNAVESGAGVGQMAVNEMTRAGISRGKGQRYYGDIAQSAADVKGAADAGAIEMDAAQANAASRFDYDNTMKQERLANAGLLEQLRSNSASERMARQGWQQDLYETLMRGQLGLDSMYLDRTPLIEALYRS